MKEFTKGETVNTPNGTMQFFRWEQTRWGKLALLAPLKENVTKDDMVLMGEHVITVGREA